MRLLWTSLGAVAVLAGPAHSHEADESDLPVMVGAVTSFHLAVEQIEQRGSIANGSRFVLNAELEHRGGSTFLSVRWKLGEEPEYSVEIDASHLEELDLSGALIVNRFDGGDLLSLSVPYGKGDFCFQNYDGRSRLVIDLKSGTDMVYTLYLYEDCQSNYRYFRDGREWSDEEYGKQFQGE